MAHPRQRPVSPAIAACAVLLAGCSVFPVSHPPYVEDAVEVEYHFGPSAERLVAVPTSSDAVTVLELTAEPAASEAFVGNQRVLRPDPSAQRLLVRCRFRRYLPTGGEAPLPDAAELFPGAATVRSLYRAVFIP
jgi:hypothetical protein